MAKQVIEKPVVNRNAVNAIAGAITTALREVNGTGSLLTQVCEVARKLYRGVAIPAIDVEAILVDLAQRMKWKPGATTDSRRSEYKAVLATYHVLPEATHMYRDKVGACTWHNGIALARLIKGKAKGNAARAVTMYASSRKSSRAAPANRKDSKANAARALKHVLKLPHLERAFVEQLRSLCGEFSINV